MKINRINDWRVVEREDGSVFIESGNPRGRHHLAFDVACEKHIAQLFCSAANSQAAAIEQAVKETAEECATKAQWWQGEAIGPFESCSCGAGISKSIREDFGIAVQSPANGEASDTGAQGVQTNGSEGGRAEERA